jgi:hypothetical protein
MTTSLLCTMQVWEGQDNIAYCPMDSERSGAGYKECAAQVPGVLQLAGRPDTTLGPAHSSHKSFGS